MIRLLAMMGACLAPQSEDPFTITIRQGGEEIPERDGGTELERAPFEIVIRMREKGAVCLHVSTNSDVARALKDTDRLDDISAFELGKGFAERRRNQDEDLLVDADGFHCLYLESAADHRFSTVVEQQDGWTCTRKVSSFCVEQEGRWSQIAMAEFSPDSVYLSFVWPRRFRTRDGDTWMAIRKETRILRFKK